MGVRIVTGSQLRGWLATGQRHWLVHASERAPFAAGHLPGAVAFPDLATAQAALLADEVVVYGADGADRLAASWGSALTGRAAATWWYRDGLREWRSVGAPVERPTWDPPARPEAGTVRRS